MTSWCTNRLAFYPDYVSASGASEIRLLIQRESGEITHALVPPKSTAQVAILDGIIEFFYISNGSGRLRCSDSDRDQEIFWLRSTAVERRENVSGRASGMSVERSVAAGHRT